MSRGSLSPPALASSAAPSLGSSAVRRQGLAGGLGGFLVFILLEPAYAAAGWQESTLFGASESTFREWLPALGDAGSLFLPGMLFAALVTGLLVLADDWATGYRARASARALAAVVMGLVLGAGYSAIAHAVFASLWPIAQADHDPLLMGLVRAFAWSSFGLGVGLTAGLASRSKQRAYQGCAGGLAGGFAGGLVFALAHSSATGTFARMAGFVALGASVGIATALVEQWTRRAWVQFLSGSWEGRQVSIYREETVLGRDELADLPLFGDPAVEKRAAVIQLSPLPLIQETALFPLLRVNGVPLRGGALADGDLIEIGSHRLRFRYRTTGDHRGAAQTQDRASLPSIFSDQPAIIPDMPDVSAPTPAAIPEYDPQMQLGLRISAGATKGVTVRLTEKGLSIGREIANGLPLADRKVSRFHARVERIDGCWVLTDLGSTNGTRLNGLTVTRAGLVPGDYIYLGDTVLAVERLG